MSKYNYPNWHEIKDLVTIYNEYEWDDAKVKVWDPENQREYNLVFCGSVRPSENEPGQINFVVYKNDDNYTQEEIDVENAFNKLYDELLSNNDTLRNSKDILRIIFKRGFQLNNNLII